MRTFWNDWFAGIFDDLPAWVVFVFVLPDAAPKICFGDVFEWPDNAGLIRADDDVDWHNAIFVLLVLFG